MGSCGKTCRRACWPNLEAHPAHDESEVSFRICSRDIEVTSLRVICHSERSRGSPMNYLSIWPRDLSTLLRSAQDDDKNFAERIGIEPTSPLEGIRVSDLLRSPSSRILAAKLTAFGV